MTLQCMRHSLIYFYSIGQSASSLPLHHNNNDAHAQQTLGSIIWRCDAAVRAHRTSYNRRDKSCSPKSVTAEPERNQKSFAGFFLTRRVDSRNYLELVLWRNTDF